MKSVFLFISLLFSSFSFAASNDYKCAITNAVEPNTNGELYEMGDSSVIGKEFTVDRATGIMVGTLKNNQVNYKNQRSYRPRKLQLLISTCIHKSLNLP